jgi:predicted nucleic acid-binding protein
VNLVVDASALVAAATTTGAGSQELRDRLLESTNHAPHLIDAELGNVLRQMTLRGALPVGQARAVLASAPGLIDHRYEHRGRLATAAWGLRTNLTFYDALYVALASSLSAVLVTTDARLSRTPDLPCELDVVG